MRSTSGALAHVCASPDEVLMDAGASQLEVRAAPQDAGGRITAGVGLVAPAPGVYFTAPSGSKPSFGRTACVRRRTAGTRRRWA
ncbi:MAG: hypothetical protein EOO73_22080 [Myxococcales bacterium]|nr:MAG: hypothetical protein EOO73_22080 [Myxococcales bacterium]